MHGVCSDHCLSNSERTFTALPLATESVQTFGDDSYGNSCNFYLHYSTTDRFLYWLGTGLALMYEILMTTYKTGQNGVRSTFPFLFKEAP